MPMPELHDTAEEIVCPLCHGTGKTTGKAIYAFLDGLLGRLHMNMEKALADMRAIFMRRLWNAKREAD